LISAVALILANMLPFWNVVVRGWTIYEILLLYWLENMVIGVFNALRMFACAKRSKTVRDRFVSLRPAERKGILEYWASFMLPEELPEWCKRFFKKCWRYIIVLSIIGPRFEVSRTDLLDLVLDGKMYRTGDDPPAPLSPAEREALSDLIPESGTDTGPLFQKSVLVALFVIQYGFFIFVHGLAIDWGFGPAGLLAKKAGAGMPVEYGDLFSPLAVLTLSHGISFFVNFIGRDEFRNTAPDELILRPYGRIGVLDVSLYMGGILVALVGTIWGLLSIFVLLKIWMDLRAHAAERRKFACSGG
jgi:hypothetical protein